MLRLAVVWVLLVVAVVVHGLRLAVIGVIVARAAGAAAQHPGVVAERWEVFARAPAGVHVAADEVGEEEEEEDGDDGVADGGAGLDGRERLAMYLGVWREGKGALCWVVLTSLHHHEQRPSS